MLVNSVASMAEDLQALRHGQIDGLPLAPDAEACGCVAADGLNKLLHIADIRAVQLENYIAGENAHGVCQAAIFNADHDEALCLSQSQRSHVVLDDRANVEAEVNAGGRRGRGS